MVIVWFIFIIYLFSKFWAFHMKILEKYKEAMCQIWYVQTKTVNIEVIDSWIEQINSMYLPNVNIEHEEHKGALTEKTIQNY